MKFLLMLVLLSSSAFATSYVDQDTFDFLKGDEDVEILDSSYSDEPSEDVNREPSIDEEDSESLYSETYQPK